MSNGTRRFKIAEEVIWNELRQILANDQIGRFATFEFKGTVIEKVGLEYQMWQDGNYITTVEGCDNAAHWLLG